MDLDLHATSKRRVASLASAAQWLGDAAALDPGNDLLHVHLGRVQALRFQDEEATRILGSVLATTRDDATAYLAGVFIAAVRERQNRLPDAAAAYRAALERFPRGHAARIGLSHVLQQDGKGDAAREALANLLGEAGGATREPLWWYTFEPAGVADSRLDALRQEVRR
jgi:predicted Zn-dependent protease